MSNEKVKPGKKNFVSNTEAIRLRPDGEFVWVEFDLPGEKANKLSTPVMMRLREIISELSKSSFKAALLVSKKSSIYIAGADISEIRSLKTAEEASAAAAMGQEIFLQLESLPMLTVAAIHGACMGGGCEMVLACDFRLGTDDSSTKIGLPEVMLGVIPGFGGTQRLPRLIGLQASLDIILAGKSVPGKKALKMGLIDKCVPRELLEVQARRFAEETLKKGFKKRTRRFKAQGLTNKILEGVLGRGLIFSQAKKTVLEKTGGHYPAPLVALDVVRRSYGGNLKKGLALEAKCFGEVASTEVSKNLINIYFMTEAVKKQSGIEADGKPVPMETPEVKSVGVLGAGTMGGGIAQLAAEKGLAVRLKDLSVDAIAKGLKAAADIFLKDVKRKKMNKYDYQRKMSLISGGTDYSGFKDIDVVVEAIVEDMEVKKKVLNELAGVCKGDVIIASNTSSLSITEMSKALSRPELFVGMHFFNPVHKMPLIEVIRGERTGDLAAATIFGLAKKMGKIPVMVKDGPGFLVNRLLMPYLNEACYIMADGCSVEYIDKTLLKFGMPMGPLHLIDEVGIDVGAKVAKILAHGLGPRAEPAPIMARVVDAKKLGKKNNSGFYLYDHSGKKLQVDPKIYEILGLGHPKNLLGETEIVNRSLYPMVNEAAMCLEEGIVTSAEAVDLGMIMGTGFPPFRGGVLRWADKVGVEKIVDDLEILATKYGVRFKPSGALRSMAKTNRKFYK